MTLKAGSRGFRKLAEGFETPRWREALVVSLENEWLQCLVRCSRAEIEKSEFSHIENDEGIFCLVEAPFDKLLGGAPEACKELAADLKELLKAGLTAVHSEGELMCATASDQPRPRAVKKKKKSKEKRASSTSSSRSSEEETDLAAALRKKWLGSGTTAVVKERQEDSDSPFTKKKRSRFAKIERKHKDSRRDTSKDKGLSEDTLLKAAASSSDPLQGLLALQIAQN